jgi:hypothetical protein
MGDWIHRPNDFPPLTSTSWIFLGLVGVLFFCYINAVNYTSDEGDDVLCWHGVFLLLFVDGDNILFCSAARSLSLNLSVLLMCGQAGHEMPLSVVCWYHSSCCSLYY